MAKIFSVILFLVHIFPEASFSSSHINVSGLRCEYIENPLGMDNEHPKLSWLINSEERNQKQTAYQILVSSKPELLEANYGDIWDSQKVKSDQSNQVIYQGENLKSKERYYWKVRIWDTRNNNSEWSSPSFWEMGLLEPNLWKAHWIGYDCETLPLIRREFKIAKSVKEARVYISGLGYYELRINGYKIGNQVLDPGQTDYEKRIFYVEYDITNQIRLGANVIGVMLGDGWYHQTEVWKNVAYGNPRLICQVLLTYMDGSEDLICSDESWKGSSGPIVKSNVYVGEQYDARLLPEGWDSTEYDDSNWIPVKKVDSPGGKLVWQSIPPIKIMQKIIPKNITNPKSGVYVYDMGQNFAGWVKLKISAKKGTEIKLRFAEWLSPDGMIDPESTGVYATGVVPTDSYVCNGDSVEVWEPRFTYHGFQYVELTGCPYVPTLETLQGQVVYSSLTKAGEFKCSNERINQLHKMAWWTEVSNLHSIPTDCPNREKCGWLGDAFLTSEMNIFNFDASAFWSKYLLDIETSMENGLPTNVAPGRRGGGISPDWGTAYIQLVWNLYLYYGDLSVIHKHYKGMSFFMGHLQKIAKDNIIDSGIGSIFSPGRIYPQKTPPAFTTTSLFYSCAKAMMHMAEATKNKTDCDKYKLLMAKIKSSFNDKFYNRAEKTYGGQEKNTLALAFELVPEGDDLAVAANLNIESDKQWTGIFGSRYIHYILGKYGYEKTVINLMNHNKYPGYGYLISRGATTFWENWGERSFEDRPGIVGDIRSKNHPFQSGFDAWFYNGIAGINPDPENPGFKHIILKPQLTHSLDYAEANYQSIYGLISSKWQNTVSKFIWSVSVPANTTATIYLPATDRNSVFESENPVKKLKNLKFVRIEKNYILYELGSGEYSFEVKNTK